jgi:hypothetical protein
MAIGNPFIESWSTGDAMMETLWGHQMVSQLLYEKYLER